MLDQLHAELQHIKDTSASIRLICVAKKAHKLGYVTRAKAGKLQFVTVLYDANGASTVTPITEWLTADEAEKILEKS